MAKKASATTKIDIPALDTETIQVPIIGIDGSLVVHNWSEKAIGEMLAKQMGQKLKTKEAKDPDADYKASLYVATDGTHGVPACAFKSAIVRAAKDIEGIAMTDMRRRLFVVPDCKEDREFVVPLADGNIFKHRIQTDLVRIIGKPKMRMDMVRVGMGTADIRFRGEFEKWEAVLTIRYVPGLISPAEVVNLVNRAGLVGICEGRPEKSTDMGWGRFGVQTGKNGRGKKGK